MAEQPSRKRRIARRTLLVAAVILLIPPSYVSSWLLMWYALGRGWIDGPRLQRTEGTVFRPIQLWRAENLPGSDSLYYWYNMTLHGGRDIWLEERGIPDRAIDPPDVSTPPETISD